MKKTLRHRPLFKCTECGVISPHNKACFVCRGTIKVPYRIPESVHEKNFRKRKRGAGLNINIGLKSITNTLNNVSQRINRAQGDKYEKAKIVKDMRKRFRRT